jgi:hypothetical protein
MLCAAHVHPCGPSTMHDKIKHWLYKSSHATNTTENDRKTLFANEALLREVKWLYPNTPSFQNCQSFPHKAPLFAHVFEFSLFLSFSLYFFLLLNLSHP